MSRKILVATGSICLCATLLLTVGILDVQGQEGDDQKQFEEVLILTTASRVVGLGTYVAGEAYAVAAGEDPSEQPIQAIIMPYGIYPNMHVEVIADFVQPEPVVAGFTFEWDLVAPDDSTTELIQGTVAIFMADVEGQYDLTLTATDEKGNSGSTTWTVYATTYIGVGGMTSAPPAYPECGVCHRDQGRAWYETAHATIFTEAIEGLVSDHYGPNCVSCHTTGFNNRPEADNGGFDDVAREAGWIFPEELTAGNWAALVEEYPEVAAMSNIQCESCHGPGAMHVTVAAMPGDKKISLGLEYGVCAQCHAEEPYYTFPQQWEMSAHAAKTARAFWYPIGEDSQSCVNCHSGVGFIDSAAGLPMEEWRTDYQVITCAVCHDPHGAQNPNQLRVFDSVVLPDGTDVTAAGAAATCMSCHNSRQDATASVEDALESGELSTPHYSTAAELMNGTGGYTWGEDLPSTAHGLVIQGTCVTCHMAPTPGIDEDGNPLPGHDQIGKHTFAMISPEGILNTAVCADCHGEMETFAFESLFDYDGDGDLETTDAEVDGLREVLSAALAERGVGILDHHPYFEIPEDADENTYGAIYNLKFAQDDASAVHNLKYTVALLQLSYEKLTGESVPGAEILPR
jgi:hypothetical protein